MPLLDISQDKTVIDTFSFITREGVFLLGEDRDTLSTNDENKFYKSAQSYSLNTEVPDRIQFGNSDNCRYYIIQPILEENVFGVYKYDKDVTDKYSNIKKESYYECIEKLDTEDEARNYLAKLYKMSDMWLDNMGRCAWFENAEGLRWRYICENNKYYKKIEDSDPIELTINNENNVQIVVEDLEKEFGQEFADYFFSHRLHYFFSKLAAVFFSTIHIHADGPPDLLIKKTANTNLVEVHSKQTISQITFPEIDREGQHRIAATTTHVYHLTLTKSGKVQDQTHQASIDFFDASTKEMFTHGFKSLPFKTVMTMFKEKQLHLQDALQSTPKPSWWEYIKAFFRHPTPHYKKYVELKSAHKHLLQEWRALKQSYFKKWQEKTSQIPDDIVKQGSYFASLDKMKILAADGMDGKPRQHKKILKMTETKLQNFPKENLNEIKQSLEVSVYQKVFGAQPVDLPAEKLIINLLKSFDKLINSLSDEITYEQSQLIATVVKEYPELLTLFNNYQETRSLYALEQLQNTISNQKALEFDRSLADSSKYQIVSEAIETLSPSPQLQS